MGIAEVPTVLPIVNVPPVIRNVAGAGGGDLGNAVAADDVAAIDGRRAGGGTGVNLAPPVPRLLTISVPLALLLMIVPVAAPLLVLSRHVDGYGIKCTGVEGQVPAPAPVSKR